MKLAFGSDHAGFELRQELATWAREQGHDVTEFGATSLASYDYPCAADDVCPRVLSGEFESGVLVCGTGIGISIRANRYTGIRAALCTSSEMARLAREHNFANVICLGARILNGQEARSILQAFFETPQSSEVRHRNRVELLDRDICGGASLGNHE